MLNTEMRVFATRQLVSRPNGMRMIALLRRSTPLHVACALAAAGCSGAAPGNTATNTTEPSTSVARATSGAPGRRLTDAERDERPRVGGKIADSVRGKVASKAVRVAKLAADTLLRLPEARPAAPAFDAAAAGLGSNSLLPTPAIEPPSSPVFGTNSVDALNLPPIPHCVAPYHLMSSPGLLFCGYDSFTASTPQPWFQVINIQYSLPGSMSEVDYSQGSYIGSQTSYQHMDSIGIDAQVSWPGGSSIENKFTIGGISGSANSLQVTNSSGIAITTNMTDDIVHHEKDIFDIWVNPLIETTTEVRQLGTTTSNRITKVLVTSPSSATVESVTAGELLGLTPIPSYKAVSKLTDAQKQQILAMDPFWSSSGFNSASTRFQYLTSVELDGPPPGGNFVASTYDIQTDISNSSSNGIQVTDELTADWGFSSLFKAGIDLQYQYQQIQTSTQGTIADSSLKIGSLNECVHVGVDVYKDLSFGTLVTVPTSNDETGVRSGWDCCNSDHSLCEQGDPLDGTCAANSCLQAVCGEDPYCCNNWWDDICVGEAKACTPQVCGQ